jgi:hypothetical protein
MTETVPLPSAELVQKDLKKLYVELAHLKVEKIKFEQTIEDILNTFDTREALRWVKAKKIAQIEVLNQNILQYNQVRRQLIVLNRKIKALTDQ